MEDTFEDKDLNTSIIIIIIIITANGLPGGSVTAIRQNTKKHTHTHTQSYTNNKGHFTHND
jgi:hypothetical protein